MKYRVLLVGKYRPDNQMSMLRYYDMLFATLVGEGIPVTGIEPIPVIGNLPLGFLQKWLRYVDKYLVFPILLKRKIRKLASKAKAHGEKLIVHITDHSNAPYLSAAQSETVVITCHDLLAVRGALGEDTDCPASPMGKVLQSKILSHLRQAKLVVCVSGATERDLQRLAPETPSTVIHLPLNQSYKKLEADDVQSKLQATNPKLVSKPYILHVGSSLKRKNREGILRIFARLIDQFDSQLVFAGEELHLHQRELAQELGIADRVIEIKSPSGVTMEALYNGAFAFLFPSKTEGFGWPIIEAQACGCPVLAARTTSLPEVLGEGGLLRNLEDEDGFVQDLLGLQDNATRAKLIQKGFQNLARFDSHRITGHYLKTYAELVSQESPP